MKNKFLVMTLVGAGMFVAPAAFADHHKGGDKAGKMFEKHDINGDGVISKDEFMKGAEERFAKMDTDGNGEVSKDEAKAHHEAMKEKWKKMKDRKDKADSVE